MHKYIAGQYEKGNAWKRVAQCALLTVAFGLWSNGVATAWAAEEKLSTEIDPATLVPKDIVGKSPTGAEGSTSDAVKLTEAEAEKARAAKFKIGVIMQTMDIDWSKLQVQGIEDTLKQYGGTVIGVIDTQYKVDRQISAIENMIQKKPDAIISIPVDDTATGPAFKKVSEAGIKLILMDNIPHNLKFPTDYQSMVSADNRGNGQVAAKVLSTYIPQNGTVGIVGFGVDFFVTREREAGFTNWLKENRPDIKIKRATFLEPSDAGNVALNFLTANQDVKGVFTVWEDPAMGAVSALRGQGKNVPITSINLAIEVAMDMASKGMIKGVGAQQPYDQGVAEALAALKALLGQSTPPWIALPAVAVIPQNVLDSYRQIYHTDPPSALVKVYKATFGR